MINEYISNLNVRKLDNGIQNLAHKFHCGNSFMDSFLRSSQALDDGFGKTYVWLEDDDKAIIGFYNISVGSIDQQDGDSWYKIGGAVHINEFAMDQKYQGVPVDVNQDINLSDLLLKDCIDRIVYVRDSFIGFSFITLQSTPAGKSLYKRNDFEEVEEDMKVSQMQESEIDCTTMYLALDIE